MGGMISFSQRPGPAEQDRPAPDRKIEGDPLRSTWNLYSSPYGDLSAGVWHSEPGSWKIRFGAREEEFFHVTQGRCRVTAATGAVHELGPGDALLIPGGFSGVFEVLETLEKHYVIVDRGAAFERK